MAFIKLFFLLNLEHIQGLTIENIPLWKNPPGLVQYSKSTCTNNVLYSFGGIDTVYQNELKRFSLQNKIWRTILVDTEKTPSPRINPIFISYNSNLYLFGGQTTNGLTKDLWLFNTTGIEWIKQDVSGNVPSARSQVAYTTEENKLYAFGGITYIGSDSLLYL